MRMDGCAWTDAHGRAGGAADRVALDVQLADATGALALRTFGHTTQRDDLCSRRTTRESERVAARATTFEEERRLAGRVAYQRTNS